jgi:hypothetical protein
MVMRYLASVTFESPTGAPETLKTDIAAGSHQKAASVAVRAAKALYPNRRPCSIVIVLELEREVEAISQRSEGGYTDSGNMDYPPA